MLVLTRERFGIAGCAFGSPDISEIADGYPSFGCSSAARRTFRIGASGALVRGGEMIERPRSIPAEQRRVLIEAPMPLGVGRDIRGAAG